MIHFLDFVELDDHIHLLSWYESDPEPIVLDEIYEMGEVTLGPRMPVPFRLVPEEVQTPYIDVLRIPTPFNLFLGRPWIHRAGAIPSSIHQKHGSTVVLDMMRNMSYLLGMGLGRRQYGPNEFMAIPDHDVSFGLGFIPTEADYRYMTRLRKDWVRA
ncbi:hypothetical protein AAG906_002246 [Vitis piasezkii]